jgi:hypothetical protein
MGFLPPWGSLSQLLNPIKSFGFLEGANPSEIPVEQPVGTGDQSGSRKQIGVTIRQ